MRLLSTDLWPTLRRLARTAHPKLAAVAYVSSDDPIQFTDGDVLVTNASEGAIRAGQTSAVVLQRAVKAGAAVVSVPDLHAKVWILGDTALVGSANCSGSSETRLLEAALVSQRADIVAQAMQLVQRLAREGQRLRTRDIEALLKLPVAPRVAPFGRKPARRRPIERVPQTWLAHLDDREFRGDAEAADETAGRVQREVGKQLYVDWFYWTGSNTLNRDGQEFDVVISVYQSKKNRGTTRGVEVSPPAIIQRIEAVPSSKTRIYYVAWPADWEERALPWSRFVEIARRAGIRSTLKPTSTLRLEPSTATALAELWPD
jgi:hypothetical protein